MTNLRKDKKLLGIWLSKAEEESLFESIEMLKSEDKQKVKFAMNNISEIMDMAYTRGDIIKR